MTEDRIWRVGDYVEIECYDGAIFQGVLQDIQDYYVLINGCGFASGTIKDMRPAPKW